MADAIIWVKSNLIQDPVTNFALDIGGEVAGGIGIVLRDDIYHQNGIIGYWLAEPFWGKGIMPHAVGLITEYAFANLGLIRLQAGVFSKNMASMRVLEKAGYHKEAILKNAVIKSGEIMDEHIFAVLK
jgi:RimJ/RimL family protein N-acetyltransferase